MKAYWALFIFIALVGCGSGGGSSPDETGAAVAAIDSRFVGLWDLTKVHEEYGEDVYYHYIGEDGTAIDYDYVGDSFDNIENCYVEVEGSQRYIREGSNYRLDIEYEFGPNIDFLIHLEIVAGILQATSLESLDGYVTEGQVFSIGPRLSGVSLTDIRNQLCSDF